LETKVQSNELPRALAGWPAGHFSAFGGGSISRFKTAGSVDKTAAFDPAANDCLP
jgi:hypothetical protein